MSGVTEAISSLAGPPAYAVVGVLAALEAAAFVGLVLPGEVAMLVGGYLAYRGRVEVAPMMAAASAGAVAGYAVGYELGRHFGGRLRQSRLGRRVGEERWERAEAYLAQRGGKAILLGRFVGVLRALVPALAGTVRMPYRKFLAWNLLGGVAWASGFVLLGYVTGASYQRVERIAGQAGLFLLAVVVMVGGIVFAARWVASHPEQVRALGSRLLERPFVRRYRGQLEFVGRRFRPGRALGLSLTVQLVALGLGGWAFGAVLQDVLTGDELVVVDGPLLRYVADHREAWLTSTLKVVTHLGSSWVLIPVLVGVGGAALRRGMGWAPLATLALAFLGAVVLQDVVKFLVSRPRPPGGFMVTTASGFAFPSGHATQAAAVYGGFAWLAAGWVTAWARKVAVWTGAVLAVLVVGVSRVYLGVHWPTDVLGGWALGGLWLAGVLVTVSTGRQVWFSDDARQAEADSRQ